MNVPFTQFLEGKILHEKYRIGGPIGVGGMGAVFRGEHLGTGRPVAVKTILPSLVRSAEALERFRREARAAGAMRHPNIVDVTDFGVARLEGIDVAYLVMEYLQGKTLGALLEERGRLEPDLAVDIIEQIAVALDVAHGSGIVHRDLKPDNIWLVPDGRGGFVIRVLDFGIAKLLEPDAPLEPAASSFTEMQNVDGDSLGHETMTREPADPTDETIALDARAGSDPDRTEVRQMEPADLDEAAPSSGRLDSSGSELTTAGTTVGTPAYMSPEQCAGDVVTLGSDIYSLGVITWQCLVGRRPFRGSFPELISQHLHERAPHVDEANPDLSPRLGEAVARALQKNPQGRYDSAGAMAGSLRVAIEGPGTILRRSAILFLERPEEFLRVSWKCAVPQLLILIPASILAWLLGPGESTAYFAAFIGALTWGLTTGTAHVAFSVVVDRLRTSPLEPIEAGTVFARINRRLGVDERRSLIRILPRLMVFYLFCELRAPAGQGDLAVQIALHEGLGPGEVKDRCAELAASTKKAYDRVRFVILGTVFAFPLVVGFLLFATASLLGFYTPDALIFAVSASMLAMPLMAVLANPVLSPSLALLYFRSRQARGENISLGAVMSSRL